MAAVTHPLEAVTGGLRNEDTEKKLDFIEELHNLGVSKYIDLPQVSFLMPLLLICVSRNLPGGH